jgi:uncharacterized protein involved in exopolysaccharide biosynthesis
MIPPTEPVGTNGLGHDDDGLPPRIHLYEYLIVIARYRWLLLGLVIGGTLLIALYSLMMPHVYPATASLLPPDKTEGLSLVSFLNSGEGFDMTGLSQNSSSEIFVKILKSQTLTDSLINRLNLWKNLGLDTNSRQLAIMTVQSGFDITSDRHGMISITYNATTPFNPSKAEQREAAEIGARIVNESIDILDRLNRQKMVSRARRSREYIGRMKELKRAERDSAQNRLLVFQERNNAIALDKQVEASIGALVEIQSQIQKKELELQGALNDLTNDSKFIENMQSQIAQLKRQRVSMENGQVGSDAYALSLRTIPDLARQYAILKLDLEVANEVYTFLEQQYNQEQVQEARDLPTVSVLDWATPSAFRSAPRRTLIVAVGFIVLFVGSLVLIFLIDAGRRYWRLNDSDKSLQLRAALRSKRKRSVENIG